MSKKFTIAKSTLLVGSALLATNVNAAGFQLNAQSATGIGRAFAGDAVIADNASVMARNAAAMTLFDEPALSLGFETIITDISVSDTAYTGVFKTESVNSDYNEAGGVSVAPNIHFIYPINDKFAVGANLYSNFGTSTEFDNASFAGKEYGGLTDIMSVNLGLSGSYRLNEQWSFGAGLDLIYGEGKLERELNIQTNAKSICLRENFRGECTIGFDTPGFDTDIEALKVDANGIGLGFNIGTVYEYNENNRFGFSYRYSPELKAEGDVEYLGEINNELYIPLPDMAEFSGYHRLNNTPFAVHYSIQWTGWGVFKTLDADVSGVLNEYEWKDGFHYSIGGTYYLNSDWTLRAGYMYDESAQDEITSISVPDSDRQWFSFGTTYHITEKSSVDFGFTYLMGKEVNVAEVTAIDGVELSSISGTTQANAILIGLQYSRSF